MLNSRTDNTKTEKNNYQLENSKHTASRSNLVYMNYDENCDPSDHREDKNFSLPPNIKE